MPRTVHIPARLPLLLFQGSNAHVVAERGSDGGCRDGRGGAMDHRSPSQLRRQSYWWTVMNTPIFDRFLFRDSSGLDLVFSGRVPATYAGPAAPAAAIATAAGMLCGRVLERTEKGAMLSDVVLYRTPAESIRLVIRMGGRPGPGPGPGTIACTSGRREIFSGRLSSEASSLQGRISGRISGERSACP